MPQHASVRDGGTGVDGVSRAGLNKIVGQSYAEGMRKPSRNGNTGILHLDSAHKLARHFLKAKWRNPDAPEDMSVLQQVWNTMQPHEVTNCVKVLREFRSWAPGPAGRGGDRSTKDLPNKVGRTQSTESRSNSSTPVSVKGKMEESLESRFPILRPKIEDPGTYQATPPQIARLGSLCYSNDGTQVFARQSEEDVDDTQSVRSTISAIQQVFNTDYYEPLEVRSSSSGRSEGDKRRFSFLAPSIKDSDTERHRSWNLERQLVGLRKEESQCSSNGSLQLSSVDILQRLAATLTAGTQGSKAESVDTRNQDIFPHSSIQNHLLTGLAGVPNMVASPSLSQSLQQALQPGPSGSGGGVPFLYQQPLPRRDHNGQSPATTPPSAQIAQRQSAEWLMTSAPIQPQWQPPASKSSPQIPPSSSTVLPPLKQVLLQQALT
eukprot:CAMPEP_0184289686 /NCGR_PEP_ID=MMETSP1049-20130417/2073_1 /TAXON_ID=77928 /ORGANISM="Proteomonas sulcata, Strain CCMP704" /LENGTH=433 /DNA_ID=CAMNT_0026596571 /DNA_START=12 /DNA_END=1313 /DNA_ORIENTATION=-